MGPMRGRVPSGQETWWVQSWSWGEHPRPGNCHTHTQIHTMCTRTQYTQRDRRTQYTQRDRRTQYTQRDRRTQYTQRERRTQYTQRDRRTQYTQRDRRTQTYTHSLLAKNIHTYIHTCMRSVYTELWSWSHIHTHIHTNHTHNIYSEPRRLYTVLSLSLSFSLFLSVFSLSYLFSLYFSHSLWHRKLRQHKSTAVSTPGGGNCQTPQVNT